jgi:hypothetical protein
MSESTEVIESTVIESDPADEAVIQRVSEMISRMKEGSPVVRYTEISASSKPEVVMCMACLTDDLDSINFIPREESTDHKPTLSSLSLSKVERVDSSNLDKFAVALLLPEDLQITELIFASESDWAQWMYGLKVLCARDGQSDETASNETEVQDEKPDTRVAELLSLLGAMGAQNEILKTMKNEYEKTIDFMSDSLREKDAEISHLTSLLAEKDNSISELKTVIKPNESQKPPLTTPKLVHPSSASTASFGLENLEEQLKRLDERKRQLELLLASVGGA